MPDRQHIHPLDAIDSVVSWLPRWLASLTILGLPVIGTVLITLGQNFRNGRDYWQFWTGVAVLLLAVAIQILRDVLQGRNSYAESTEAARLRVAMKDALQPVAELTAGMTELPGSARQPQMKQVAQQAVGSLCLLLKDVDRLRAVVYEVTDRGMECLAYQGRGTTPKMFKAGTERGDKALKMVDEGGQIFAKDLDASELGPAYKGSGADYKTFISVAISTRAHSYGMLTVDAPRAGDLVDTDAQIVMFMADLLAVAFAVAVDGPQNVG